MHEKFEINRTKIKGGCQSRSTVVTHNSKIDFPLACQYIIYRVGDAVRWLEKFKASHIPVAAVATGFPSGQYSLTTRLEEIKYAINEGAKEIDIVINRTLALQVSTYI